MTRLATLPLLAAVAASAAAARAPAQTPWTPTYPSTHRGTQVDDVGALRVADPYRWLEDVGSSDVRAWAEAQTTVARSYLAQLPRRDEAAAAAARAWSAPRWDAPRFGGDRVFVTQSDGAENQPVIYVEERRDQPIRALVDPNAFSAEGFIAIVDQAPSPDGRYVAYAVSIQGSSWLVIRVRDVRTNQDLTEELRGVWDPHIAWTLDDRGFVYLRSDVGRPGNSPLAPQGRQQLMYHRIGQAQGSDRVIFERSDRPDWRFRVDVSQDGQYLLIAAHVKSALADRLYLVDLDNPGHPNFGAPLVTLFDAGDAQYDYVANEGPVLYLRTTKNAPRGRIVAVDINEPSEEHWTNIVRETYDPLIGAVRVGDRLVAHRLHDAHSVLELYALDGVARGLVPLPGLGTVGQLTPHGHDLYFVYSSFVQPAGVYRYDLDERAVSVFGEQSADTSLSSYETTQLFYASGDGTRIPMFITARRGITLDGTHPTLLASLGAFGDVMTPRYSPFVAAWLQLGGIYAVPNVRGGGEDGRLWHEAAMGRNKGVSVDDFIAAAEFLVNQRYTRSSLLGVVGHGAGGLLAGAAITKRPDLFGAAAIDAGLLDLARFDRFGGAAEWTPEFGSPADPADLRALLGYSPLDAIRPGTSYPPVLLTVGERDDFMTPANSFKFAAALQASRAGAGIALLRVDDGIGHGPGIPRARALALDADRLAFLVSLLRIAH